MDEVPVGQIPSNVTFFRRLARHPTPDMAQPRPRFPFDQINRLAISLAVLGKDGGDQFVSGPQPRFRRRTVRNHFADHVGQMECQAQALDADRRARAEAVLKRCGEHGSRSQHHRFRNALPPYGELDGLSHLRQQTLAERQGVPEVGPRHRDDQVALAKPRLVRRRFAPHADHRPRFHHQPRHPQFRRRQRDLPRWRRSRRVARTVGPRRRRIVSVTGEAIRGASRRSRSCSKTNPVCGSRGRSTPSTAMISSPLCSSL